jgi:hypothetical protein
MPLNSTFNQIFASQIVDRIFEDNKFLELIPNYSEYLSARTVNIPNPNVFGAGITIDSTITDFNDFVQTQEQYTTFTVNNYRIKPILVEQFDEIVTSYDKLAFVTRESLNELSDAVAKKVLVSLASDVDSTRKFFTTGTTAPNGFNGESFKSLQWSDLVRFKQAFDADKVAQTNRVVILDEQYYADMMNSDFIVKQMNFNVQDEGIAKTGAISQVLGMNILMKPTIASVQSSTSGNAVNPYNYTVDRTV